MNINVLHRVATKRNVTMNALQQAALVDLSQSALVGTDLAMLLDQAAEIVAHTLDVEFSQILELIPDGSALLLRAGIGWAEGVVGHATIDTGTSSPAGYTLLAGLPVIVEDWSTETRFNQPSLERDHQVSSGLYVIIQGRSRPFGVVGADGALHGSFGDDDVRFLQVVANLLGMAIERFHAEEALRASEARFQRLAENAAVAEGLREILAILNSNRPLDEILDYIIAQACYLLSTPSGAIYRLNPHEGMLSIRASHGLDADDAAVNLPVSWGSIGQTVLHRRPVAVTDTALAASGECSPATTQRQTCLMRLIERYRAVLIVPLIVKDDIYGAIALYYHQPRAFSDEEVDLACTVSDQAALAIENARLVVAAQGKAVLEERQRLARDLHDSVTQALYGITLYAEAGARILRSGDITTVADQLGELQEMAQGALQEMRLLIFELRPPVLEAEGLVTALRTRLEVVEGRSNLETTFSVEGMSRLSVPIEQALYRIAQEALNNVLRHAHALHVTLLLRREQSRVIMEVTDDGVGFDPAIAREQGGLGLCGIAERVAQLGGRLTLQSAPGDGTRVRVEISV